MTLIKFRNAGMHNFPNMERNFAFPSIFSDAFDRFWADEEISWMPAVNITERAKDYKIDLAAAGMDKKDFRVEVEKGILIVSGERKEEKLEEKDKSSRREFHYGTFRRNFSLPETANASNIQASYKDGILSLVVAKHEESKEQGKKLIEIQ